MYGSVEKPSTILGPCVGLTSHSLSDRVSVNLGLLVFLLEVENNIQVTEVSCKSIGIHIEHVSMSNKTRLKAQEEFLYKKFHGSNKIMIYIHLKTILGVSIVV